MSKLTKRGIIFPSLKQPAESRPIIDITLPSRLIVPLISGNGSDCRLTVKVNDTVLKGDIIATSDSETESCVHSPATGVLSGRQTIFHPLLGNTVCAVIDCISTKNETGKSRPTDKLSSEEIIELAHKKGIVDELDGQPLAEKLSVCRKNKNIMLIADGSDQEPYGSSSWAVINQFCDMVYNGLKLAGTAANTNQYKIGVKLNKKQFSELQKKYNQIDSSVFLNAGRKYPTNYKLARTNTGKMSVCRIGVQACLALYSAAAFNHPPNSCVVTVAGDCVANPQNVRVPFGTLIDDLLRFCGLADQPEYIIIGDAMTGITIQDTNIPIVSGITCLLAIKNRTHPPVHPCIGCGRCAEACHAGLLPYEIMRRLDNMQYERLDYLLPEECDGCGVCSHVCPSGLEVAYKVLEARDAQGNIFMKWGTGDEL